MNEVYNGRTCIHQAQFTIICKLDIYKKEVKQFKVNKAFILSKSVVKGLSYCMSYINQKLR